MDDIYKNAHIMTKNICQEYGDVDYKTQFKLCKCCCDDSH